MYEQWMLQVSAEGKMDRREKQENRNVAPFLVPEALLCKFSVYTNALAQLLFQAKSPTTLVVSTLDKERRYANHQCS